MGLVMVSWCSVQTSSSRRPLSLQFPTLCLPKTPFQASESRPTWHSSHQRTRPCHLAGCPARVCEGRCKTCPFLQDQPPGALGHTEECEALFVVDWKAHVHDSVRVDGG